ncbi:tRNA adenosine(34) deaminase TadA [Pedococcus bigeumensis]|uniref:tRNA-specific adenosine deaminase n=1 Tax=Pedococcus bigeumensis TaxID=433644 RepID=A0A502CSI1_9MICO|nr:tRNA adenosine(34) deaminase TadA [Pedococcus bigeumensis]TPG15069.1 nucleoside deaminase [Pedococcus bigeumensis]
MGLALDLAAQAARDGDVPVGAVVISPAGEVIGEGRNLREVEGDPTAHAEVVALRAAARSLGQWRLEDCTLVVTLEPCPMCAGALMLSRISRLVLGAWDPKLGATGSVWDLVRDRRATHRVEVIGGVRASECSQVLLTFFDEQRAAGGSTALGTALGTAAETAQGDGRVAGA